MLFERWSQLVELKVSSLHPDVAVFWQAVRMAAGAAYDQYLWLNPMQKVCVAVDVTSIETQASGPCSVARRCDVYLVGH